MKKRGDLGNAIRAARLRKQQEGKTDESTPSASHASHGRKGTETHHATHGHKGAETHHATHHRGGTHGEHHGKSHEGGSER
jgi:hypothetical protein